MDRTVFFDKEGVPIREARKAFVENGTSVVYNSVDPSYWLAGGPGERELVTFDLWALGCNTANGDSRRSGSSRCCCMQGANPEWTNATCINLSDESNVRVPATINF